MRETRLFKILYYLLEKGQATAPELAEKFEVSVRTIYRDMDALSEAGIPVYTENGRNGGIRLMDHFVLERALLSEEEKQEILGALKGFDVIRGMEDTDTLSKLAALFHIDRESWLEIDLSRWGNHHSDNDKFACFKSAAIRHRCVKITYASSCESVSCRIIQPLKLIYKSKSWYVKAYCTKRQDFRLFKLSRILEWETQKESFIPGDFPEESEAPQKEYPPVVLRFPKEMAYRVYDEFDKTDIRQLENGDFLVCSQMPEDSWLIGFLLSFGGKVEIIEPVHLKGVLAQQARIIYEQNKT